MNNTTPAKKTDILEEISLFMNEPGMKQYKKLLKLLDIPPKAEWIKDHPFAKGVKYIPIGIIETMLQRVFGRVRIDVKESKIMANSLVVCARVYYWNSAFKDWDYHDGLGAIAIQVDSGKKPTDFDSMKSNAVMIGLPCAKSYAIKDACEHLGKLFGRDLNRKEFMEYTDLFPEPINLEGISKHQK